MILAHLGAEVVKVERHARFERSHRSLRLTASLASRVLRCIIATCRFRSSERFSPPRCQRQCGVNFQEDPTTCRGRDRGSGRKLNFTQIPFHQPKMLSINPHPLLDLAAFVTNFSHSLGQIHSSGQLLQLLSTHAAAPLASSDEVRSAVRDLLRHGGFKPTGRNKPASEYLIRAAREGQLDSINVAVDVCNAVSLHSGLPISVIDLERTCQPFEVAIASTDAEYVFNPAGQTIKLDGLVCLFDSDGPCANAVRDSQRTKTSEKTRHTLSLIWGTSVLSGRTSEALVWYHQLLVAHGATVQFVHPAE